jgi:hypothetical protein
MFYLFLHTISYFWNFELIKKEDVSILFLGNKQTCILLTIMNYRKNLINWKKKKNWINDESDERRYDTYKEDKKNTKE